MRRAILLLVVAAVMLLGQMGACQPGGERAWSEIAVELMGTPQPPAVQRQSVPIGGAELGYGWGASRSDTAADCEIEYAPSSSEGGPFVHFVFSKESWIGLGLLSPSPPLDATGMTGIEIVAWADHTTDYELEVACQPVSPQYYGYFSQAFELTSSQKTIRIPLDTLMLDGVPVEEIPEDHLGRIIALKLFPKADHGTLSIAYIGFYMEPEEQAPVDTPILRGTITRAVSQEQIPFTVQYQADFPGLSAPRYQWTIEADGTCSSAAEGPFGTGEDGPESQFTVFSNACSYTVRLLVEDKNGNRYEWADSGVEFPLHNQTAIKLNGQAWFDEEGTSSVLWSASNGDPADAATFPITAQTSLCASLTSEWPNVLQVSCERTDVDGVSQTKTAEALVFFRDGSPFANRGTAATVFVAPSSQRQLASILDQMFTELGGLGFNAIVTSINWWYGFPDADGNFTIDPIAANYGWEGDPRGGTVSDTELDLLLDKAHEYGFDVSVQLMQYQYRNDTDLAAQYHSSGWGQNGFRTTDGFLYGDGEGLQHALRYYISILAEHQVSTVFLGAEIGNVEAEGGEKSRDFYEEIIADFRGGGYTGEISYALSFYNGCGDYDNCPVMYEQNLVPAECGIPWAAMDYVGMTCYPSLADSFDATTEEMYAVATRLVQGEMLQLHEAYDLPVFIEDMYCFGHDGCGKYPVQSPWVQEGEFDPEEQRRWHTAMLRALSYVNLTSKEPWIFGVTLYEYTLDPWALDEVAEWELREKTWMNTPQRSDLRNLAKVYFLDVPVTE